MVVSEACKTAEPNKRAEMSSFECEIVSNRANFKSIPEPKVPIVHPRRVLSLVEFVCRLQIGLTSRGYTKALFVLFTNYNYLRPIK